MVCLRWGRSCCWTRCCNCHQDLSDAPTFPSDSLKPMVRLGQITIYRLDTENVWVNLLFLFNFSVLLLFLLRVWKLILWIGFALVVSHQFFPCFWGASVDGAATEGFSGKAWVVLGPEGVCGQRLAAEADPCSGDPAVFWGNDFLEVLLQLQSGRSQMWFNFPLW